MAVTKKRYIYKIFKNSPALWDVDSWDVDKWDGDADFVTSWDQEVISMPVFNSRVNAGPTTLRVKLARPFNNFGEDDDVRLNNRVDLFVYDVDEPNGKLLFRGFINSYTPTRSGEKEFIDIELWSFIARMDQIILEDSSGNTAIAYNSFDPSDILRDAIDKMRALGETNIDYDITSVQSTGSTVSIDFNVNTIREVLDKCVELAPENWYYYLDPTGLVNFKQSNRTEIDHLLTLGRNVRDLRITKNLDTVVNQVFFVGGAPADAETIYKKTEVDGSVTAYGRRAKKMVDERVKNNTTATVMSNRVLNDVSSPKTLLEFTLIDNNGNDDGLGIDLESIQVGDTVKLSNAEFVGSSVTKWDIAEWDVDVWDETIQASASQIVEILSLSYSKDEMSIVAGTSPPRVNKRIEDILRNLEKSQTFDAPIIPDTD